MNRRELFPALGTGMALASCAAIVGTMHGCAPVPASAADRISADLAAAIEKHRAAIRHDEGLYDDDCKPIAEATALRASDAAIGEAFATVVASPCRTIADMRAKADHILAGSVELRTYGWRDEFVDALVPDGEVIADPSGPLVALLRSLVGDGKG